MKFTFLGKALRAVSQDRETAGLMGINPNQLIMLTFVIASALAGMGGAMLAPVLVLTPFAGTSVIVKAFAIVIIGGFGNVEGTILAGLLVGLIESFTTQYLDPGADRHRGVRPAAPDAGVPPDRAHLREARRKCLTPRSAGRTRPAPRRRGAWDFSRPRSPSRCCRWC